jgi:hypothetical protein
LFSKALAATALAGVFAAGFAAPASATGNCDEKVEVACNMYGCSPGDPCSIKICLVYMSSRCVV